MKFSLFSRTYLSLALVLVAALGFFTGHPLHDLLPAGSADPIASLGFAPLLIGDTVTAEIKKLLDEQGRAWEEFKAKNDQRLTELEKKGYASAGTVEAVENLNDALTKIANDLKAEQDRLDAMEMKANRPGGLASNPDDQDSTRIFNLSRKSAAIAAGRAQPIDITDEEARHYKSAFLDWFRKGHDDFALDKKALSVGSDVDGGFLVPGDMSGRIIRRLYDLSPIRRIANVQTISSGYLEGIIDRDEADAGWTGETSARNDTDTPQLGRYRISAEEMYAKPKATQTLLDDAAIDVESWLSNKVADKLARVEGAAYINGNGIAKPRGFATYTTAATADSSRAWGVLEHIKSGANGAFASSNPADVLFDIEMALNPGYRNNANWVSPRAVIKAIRKFKNTADGNYLWQPGLQAGQPSSLLGYPIVEAEDMPALATDSLSLAFGNFREGYQIVDRLGIRLLRDPFSDKPFILFYTTKRTGGAVVNFDAIKFIKFAA